MPYHQSKSSYAPDFLWISFWSSCATKWSCDPEWENWAMYTQYTHWHYSTDLTLNSMYFCKLFDSQLLAVLHMWLGLQNKPCECKLHRVMFSLISSILNVVFWLFKCRRKPMKFYSCGKHLLHMVVFAGVVTYFTI